jgi:hypothetical protein
MLVTEPGQYHGIHPTGYFADETDVLYAEDVTVVSSNPAVVEVVGSGQLLVRAVAPGVATISVIDNLTGISSDAFGESLRLGVRGPLESISLFPSHVIRRVGESAAFGAIAHYVGGASERATERFKYSSSDPAVAVATNDFFVPSLVYPTGAGTAVIDAKDPVTGISSADSAGGATVDVVGPLERLIVQPSSVTRIGGRPFSFTAIGRDALGREINLTQDVDWSVGNTAVAYAPNDPENRSRILGWQPGTTTVSAHDPHEDISSTTTGDDATFTVDGTLAFIGVSVNGTTHAQLVVGETIQLTATGYVGASSKTVNITQEVEYSASNPTVVSADNAPGDRSRVTALKPGVTQITAYDPYTGLTTPIGTTSVVITVVAP